MIPTVPFSEIAMAVTESEGEVQLGEDGDYVYIDLPRSTLDGRFTAANLRYIANEMDKLELQGCDE